MSHQYAQHPHRAHTQPPAAAIPQSGLLDYEPEDDIVYKRRYFALKNLVHALEDENNMLAFKLAQITTRCRDAEIARLRSLEESHQRARAEQSPRGLLAVAAGRAKGVNGNGTGGGSGRARGAGTGAGAGGPSARSVREGREGRAVEHKRAEKRAGETPTAAATTNRAFEDLMDEPDEMDVGEERAGGGGEVMELEREDGSRERGAAAAIDDLLEGEDGTTPRRSLDFSGSPPGGARRVASGSVDSDSQMDVDDY